MNRILTVAFIILIVFASVLSGGCADKETIQYQVDREITGQVIAIDNRGEYSTLHFANGLEVVVTNATLYEWLTNNMFINVWTYKFQETLYQNRYDLIGINEDWIQAP